MKRPNVLVIADRDDIKLLDTGRASDYWNISWEVLDYNRLHREIGKLQERVRRNKVDFIIYSRNDQIGNKISIGPVTRKLRTGYSSFSGIDNKNRPEQMKRCFSDFLECGRNLDLGMEKTSAEGVGSTRKAYFSLLFDTEQLGGVRYGMPRILRLLNAYCIKATFFVTNLMVKVYPNILKTIQEQGHEVGLHGLWHEYLSGLGREEQKNQLRSMMADFSRQIHGVNFVGRMDETTMFSLVESGFRYFVYPSVNRYFLLGYPRLLTMPSLIKFPEGTIWAFPICVETYGSPWFSIKNMVDSAISRSMKCELSHISILCHPFRDGNLQHIHMTEKLLRHLASRGLGARTLAETANQLGNGRTSLSVACLPRDASGFAATRFSLPRTGRDLLYFLPENLTTAYRIARRHHTLF